ncbi:MAG: tRNA lysidine(34) synthetase TilS [Dehalococcoidia bacterium]
MRSRRGPGHLQTQARSRFGQRLERRVLRYIQDRGLLSTAQRVLLAVSGGPDSTALFLVLAHLAASDALKLDLRLAHFNHGLRPQAEREAERVFLAGLAAKLGLPLFVGQGDVRRHARQHRLSVEEAARELRYRFLAQEAEKAAIDVVATGHTADDQAETVLMHLVRGSGLTGLAGMQPSSPWPFPGHQNLLLVRPLLQVTRRDTERYCQEEGLSPCLDATNLLLGPLRNRIRHQLLPLLRSYNPRIEAALLRLAAATASDLAFLDKVARAFWQSLAVQDEGSVSFRRSELAALAPAIRNRLLRTACQQLLADARQIEAVHIQAMAEALAKPAASRLSLPDGLAFAVDGEFARLTLGQQAPAKAGPIPEAPLAVPGRTTVTGWLIETEILPGHSVQLSPDPYQAFLDYDALGGQLTVRSRRRGDRFQPLGLGGEKKLQDFLVDAKVPRDERDAVPLVCASWGIAWVVGHRIDQRARVREDTHRVLHLKLRRQDSQDNPNTASAP